MAIAANTRVADKFPSVFLHKHDGTGQSSKHSILHPGDKIRQFSAPTKFQLIPLTGSGDILRPEGEFCSRSSFWKEFKRWKHVAIRCEKKGAFLSCSRKPGIPVGYKSIIGVSERFELTHFSATESFSFRSHNGIYLSHNRALGSIVFRAESKREGTTIASHRTWEVTPVLGFASTDPRIKFVGAIDSSKRVVMNLQPDEIKIKTDGVRNTNVTKHEDDEKYRDKSNQYMSHATSFVTGEGLRHGECTHFLTPSGDLHYYVRDKRGTVFLVVVSEGFSRALAGECLNELCAIHKKLVAGKHNHHPVLLQTKTEQLKRRKLLEHELRFLVWNYNEHNEAFRHHPLRNRICKNLEDAIDTVLDYKGNRLTFRLRVKHLNHTADAFRATMRRLRARQVSKWVVVGAVGGGSVGALVGASVGMAMGGPAGAAFIGAQAAKVGALVVGSGASVGVALQHPAPLMWKKHVHHSSPPPSPPSYKLLYQNALARYK